MSSRRAGLVAASRTAALPSARGSEVVRSWNSRVLWAIRGRAGASSSTTAIFSVANPRGRRSTVTTVPRTSNPPERSAKASANCTLTISSGMEIARARLHADPELPRAARALVPLVSRATGTPHTNVPAATRPANMARFGHETASRGRRVVPATVVPRMRTPMAASPSPTKPAASITRTASQSAPLISRAVEAPSATRTLRSCRRFTARAQSAYAAPALVKNRNSIAAAHSSQISRCRSPITTCCSESIEGGAPIAPEVRAKTVRTRSVAT